MDLPIDVVPGTTPPRFRWKQVVETFSERQVVDHEGSLPPSVEGAVVQVIAMVKVLRAENKELWARITEISKPSTSIVQQPTVVRRK